MNLIYLKFDLLFINRKHILKNDLMTQKIQLQLLPLSLKNNININQLSFSTDNCAVSVFYTIYDSLY